MRMRYITWPGGSGSSKTTYLESTTQIACSLCNFYVGIPIVTFNFYVGIPIVKWFPAETFLSSVKNGPKYAGFSGIAVCKF